MDNTPELLTQYINQMTPKEKKAMEIARKLLRDSFDLKKSNGFLEFKAKLPSNSG